MRSKHEVFQTRIPFYQVDAFTHEIFSGNPAAVCLLEHWPDDVTLRNIACENNLSETAFVVKEKDREGYELRWFTPLVEVELCGHATLAAASVLFKGHMEESKSICFHTRSGELKVRHKEGYYTLDFPLVEPVPVATPNGLLSALGIRSTDVEVWMASDLIVVINDERELDRLTPDFPALARFPVRGIVVTARSRQYDFRSRWFGPQVGVDEDPVTGSAHTFLAPLWAKKLQRDSLFAQQGGRRKGELHCRLTAEGRVELTGKARLMIEGYLIL